MKNRLTRLINGFWTDESGATATEYAIMLALIVITCVAAVGSIGENANIVFETIANTLSP